MSLPPDMISITITEWDRVTGERDRLREEVERLARVSSLVLQDSRWQHIDDARELEMLRAMLSGAQALTTEQIDTIEALRARVAEAVRMIEGYKRAGLLTNPATAEQATDFISRATGNKDEVRK